MASNLNRVIISGNLTTPPQLRVLDSGTSVCRLRVASNTRRKTSEGNWEDRANYFDVIVWGAQATSCDRYLAKGRAVAIDGRLEWREWKAQDGTTRQTVEIVADTVQFLGPPPSHDNAGASSADRVQRRDTAEAPPELAPAAAAGPPRDDEIPF